MSLLTACCAAQGGAPVPPVGCAYPLNGDVTGAPFQPMTISGSGLQTATVAIAGNGAYAQYVAVPSGAFPGPFATLALTSGIKVVGFNTACPAAVDQASVSPSYFVEYSIIDTSFATVVKTDITATADGLYTITVYVGATAALTLNGAASIPAFIAYVFDAGGGTVDVIFDGVSQTLSTDAFTPQACLGSIFAQENAASAAGDSGKVIGGTIVTTASQLSGTYPSGATDPCGTVI